MSSKIDELENKFQKVMEGEVSKLKEEFNKNHPQNWSNKRNIYILITVNSTIAEEEKTMSEVKEWLETFSIPGIECLQTEFGADGFSTRRSLQYLEEVDLDYTFSSPKSLQLAEKPAITKELQQLKLTLHGGSGTVKPRKLNFGEDGSQQFSTPKCSNGVDSQSNSPLKRRKQELMGNVSFLEVQIVRAEEYLSQL